MSEPQAHRQIPGVVFQPHTSAGMQRGIDRLVAAIRPTLGPIHRSVLIQQQSKLGLPELLDNAALIARRIIALPDRDEDMGAMYLRQLLWSMYESVGDGTATAALMFHSIYTEGLRYVAAGGDAMCLRGQLENALLVMLQELKGRVFSLEGKTHLSRLAETICYNPELARLLGEIFDIIGDSGQLDIQAGQGRKMEREYVEGMYWRGGLCSREMASGPDHSRAGLENCAVLAADLEIREPTDLLPVLQVAAGAGIGSLLLTTSSISERALSVLLLKANRDRVKVVATKLPGETADDHREGLEDLSILTGGRCFLKATGDTFASLKAADFGLARRAWADRDHFGIVGGKGDPHKLREHIGSLRAGLAQGDDQQARKRLRERIGRLLGGSAILSIGDPSPIAIQAKKELAVRTAEAMRGAMQAGVVAGGGIALLGSKPLLLRRSRQAENEDERAAYRILAHAVETPIRVLLENAGVEPVPVLHEIAAAGAGCGFDARRRCIVNMAEVGIVDCASVIEEAAIRSVRGAALALTVDVLVHRAKPPLAFHTT